MGAWYDIFLGGTLKNYVRLKTEAGTEAARRGQRLAVSVGGHAGESSSGKVGGGGFGQKLPAGEDEAGGRWYEWLVEGGNNVGRGGKPGRSLWHGENEGRER